MALYKLVIDDSQLRVVMDRAKLRLTPAELGQIGQGLALAAAGVQKRATANVQGNMVRYEGGAFHVNVRTGTLRGSINMEWPYMDWLQARVFVNGTHSSEGTMSPDGRLGKPVPVSKYAAAIEYGHGEIDLKKTMLGKIVPFFASKDSNATGPYAVRGLTKEKGASTYHNVAFNNKLQALGKANMNFTKHAGKGRSGGSGAYFISFRRVGKTGWIIPAAKPRPFMRAALSNSRQTTHDIMGDTLANVIAGRGKK
jgi:hypothetical protein